MSVHASRLSALADPLRLRMGLLLLDDARTVKELAAELDVPPTRLYYHVKILEEQELIEVVERRMVSGIEERRYRAVEQNWLVDPDITASAFEASGIVDSLFKAIRAELEVVMHDHPEDPMGEPGSPVLMLSLTELHLTADEVAVVQQRLASTLDEFGPNREVGADARPYRMLLAGYEVPGRTRRAS